MGKDGRLKKFRNSTLKNRRPQKLIAKQHMGMIEGACRNLSKRLGIEYYGVTNTVLTLILLAIVLGIGLYFTGYLPEKGRYNAQTHIQQEVLGDYDDQSVK